MTLTQLQKDELLSVVRGVLPQANWAPEEAWIEDSVGDKEARRGSEPVHFQPLCFCQDRKESAELTLFLKGPLKGEHYNTVTRIEKAVEGWAKKELKWEGCGTCQDRLAIDVRFFRTDPVKRVDAEEDGEVELVVGDLSI